MHIIPAYSLADMAKTILGRFHGMYFGDRINFR